MVIVLPCSRSGAELIGEVSQRDGGVYVTVVAGHRLMGTGLPITQPERRL